MAALALLLAACGASGGEVAIGTAGPFETGTLPGQRRRQAVVGHANSGGMAGAARVYDRGLVAVIPSGTSPELTGVSPWVYRVTTEGLHERRAAQPRRRTAPALR